jgi:FKBP-type peptidyl-prolyl cis-trans isomerase
MANLGQRIFAFTMAAVFLISSCALAGFALYEQNKDRQKNDQQKAVESASKASANASAGKPLENYEPVEKVESLQTTDIKVGDGAEAKETDKVSVHYTGAVASTGKIFQSSKDTGAPVTLSLDSVIAGWKEGIPGMKEGGIRRLMIPAEKAYGANPPQGSGIPPNAALVFDVELVKVNPPEEQPQGQPEAKPEEKQ